MKNTFKHKISIKRTISIILMLSLIFTACSTMFVSADVGGNVSISVVPDKTEIKPGDSVSFDVYISSSEPLTSSLIGFELGYDTHTFVYEDVVFNNSEDALGENSSDWEELSGYNKDKLKFIFISMDTRIDTFNSDAPIARVTLTSKTSAKAGEKIIYIDDFGGVNQDIDDISADTSNASVYVSEKPQPTVRPSVPTETPVQPTAKPDPTATPVKTASPSKPLPGATATPTATMSPSETSKPTVTATAAPSNDIVFTDVQKSHWAFEYIMDLYNAGIVNGSTSTTFMPDNNVTRAEFTKMAVSMFGIETGSADLVITSQFTDVKSTDWFAPFVASAVEEGMVTGVSETEFAPDKTVTREEMATIIGRKLKLVSETAPNFTDSSSIEEYAVSYVAALSEHNLLTGSNGLFRPKDTATRAEAATLLDKVYKDK